MAKPPKWLRRDGRLLVEVRIAYIADDDSFFSVQLPNGQRVRFETDTVERLIETGEVGVGAEQ